MSLQPVITSSVSIERSLLGALILDATRVIECMDCRRVGHELFTAPNHQTIYRAIREMSTDGVPVSSITLAQRLRDANSLFVVGGLETLEACIDACPTATHAEFFIDDLSDRAARRAMLQLVDAAKRDIGNPDESSELVRGRIEASFAKLTQQATTRPNSALLADQAEMYARAIQGGCAGLRSGFRWLDEAFGGLQPQVYYVFSGPPGCFKTTLVRNIVEYVAGFQGLRVDFASLEQSAGQILSSMAARLAGVSISTLNAGRSEQALERWRISANQVAKWPIFVADDAQNDATLWSWARRAKSKGSRLLVLDYLQFMQCSERCNEEQRLARASDAVRRIAKELDIPFIAISSETKGDAKAGSGPSLRHSAQIEYDAWCWVRMRKEETPEGAVTGAAVSIRKNRFGQQQPEWSMPYQMGAMIEHAQNPPDNQPEESPYP